MGIPTVWTVDLYVQENAPEPPFYLFGQKDVTVLSITSASPVIESALQDWKELGLTGLFEDPIIEIVVDVSNVQDINVACPTAITNQTCEVVANYLASRPETFLYTHPMNLLSEQIPRLWAELTNDYWFPLRFLIIFPDGTFAIYEFHSLGSAGGFQIVEETAGTSSGGATSGGDLVGWEPYFLDGATYTEVPFADFGTNADCKVGITAVRDTDGIIVSITMTTIC